MPQLTRNYFSQLLDYEEDGEFHLISATAAFMKRDLKRIAGFCEVVVPSYDQNHLRSSCTRENRGLGSSHVDASRDVDKKWRMAWNLFRVANG